MKVLLINGSPHPNNTGTLFMASRPMTCARTRKVSRPCVRSARIWYGCSKPLKANLIRYMNLARTLISFRKNNTLFRYRVFAYPMPDFIYSIFSTIFENMKTKYIFWQATPTDPSGSGTHQMEMVSPIYRNATEYH